MKRFIYVVVCIFAFCVLIKAQDDGDPKKVDATDVTKEATQIQQSAQQTNDAVDKIIEQGNTFEKELGRLRAEVHRIVVKDIKWSRYMKYLSAGFTSAFGIIVGVTKSDDAQKNWSIAGALTGIVFTVVSEFFQPAEDKIEFLENSNRQIGNWVTKRNSLSTLPISTGSMTQDDLNVFKVQKVESEKNLQSLKLGVVDLRTFLNTEGKKYEYLLDKPLDNSMQNLLK